MWDSLAWDFLNVRVKLLGLNYCSQRRAIAGFRAIVDPHLRSTQQLLQFQPTFPHTSPILIVIEPARIG